MQDNRKIAVILNASAGSGCDDDAARSFVEKFATHGIEARVTLAKNGSELVGAAKQAVKDGFPMVAAGGGDGTQNAVASELIGTDVVYGVLPMGTLNHFAKDLGIPLAIDDAIATIAAGHSTEVDTAEVNGRSFLNNSSLGLYPDTVRMREMQQSRLGRSKWPAFFWAALTSLKRYPFLNLQLTTDKISYRQRTPFIFIGNNDYIMEGFNIGARSSLQDGRLSLYFAHRTGRVGLLVLAVRAVFGRLKQAKDFEMLQARTLTVESRHRQLRVSTDGEVNLMETPLVYKIVPRSLNVFVPAPDHANKES
ncbi:MAG: diacylglycerol kinase family protein [Pseudomonadota bacterium]